MRTPKTGTPSAEARPEACSTVPSPPTQTSRSDPGSCASTEPSPLAGPLRSNGAHQLSMPASATCACSRSASTRAPCMSGW